MAGARVQAVAGLIVAKVPGAAGGEAYFRKGKFLPATVPNDEIKRLLSLELVKRVPVEVEVTAPAELTAEALAAKATADQAEAAKAADAAKAEAAKPATPTK